MSERKKMVERYLELTKRVAVEGETMGDDEVDAIAGEMRVILMSFQGDDRRDLITLGEQVRKLQNRRMRRSSGQGLEKDSNPPPIPFVFLCRISRGERSRFGSERWGPGWLSYLRSLGIVLPFKELVLVNDDEGGCLVYRVEGGRLF